jgi:hypothetical protein
MSPLISTSNATTRLTVERSTADRLDHQPNLSAIPALLSRRPLPRVRRPRPASQPTPVQTQPQYGDRVRLRWAAGWAEAAVERTLRAVSAQGFHKIKRRQVRVSLNGDPEHGRAEEARLQPSDDPRPEPPMPEPVVGAWTIGETIVPEKVAALEAARRAAQEMATCLT